MVGMEVSSALEIKRDDLVQLHSWHLDHDRGAFLPKGDFAVCDQEPRLDHAPFTRNPANAHFLPRDGYHFTDRSLQHHRVCQVYQVRGNGMLLAPDRNVKKTLALNFERRGLVRRP